MIVFLQQQQLGRNNKAQGCKQQQLHGRLQQQGALTTALLVALTLKAVTNEKGEAIGEVLTIIC